MKDLTADLLSLNSNRYNASDSAHLAISLQAQRCESLRGKAQLALVSSGGLDHFEHSARILQINGICSIISPNICGSGIVSLFEFSRIAALSQKLG